MSGSLDTLRLGFFLASVTLLVGFDDSEFQKSMPAEIIWAVPGKDADLPCDIAPEDGDSLSMVLWFKGASGIPLYSLDARNGSILHWAMGTDLGGRTYFILGKGSSPSRLRITNVVAEDEGIYRCRVDFFDSPTRNFQYNMTLVIMPSEPMVYDHQGREVNGVAGPYLQGYDLFLSCHVVGGRPKPLVTWWRDMELLDDSMESVTGSLSVNHYSRPNVTRDLFNNRLQCRVVVSHLVRPLMKEVTIDIYLKPERIVVSSIGAVRSSGRPQQFQCEAWGSVPPAKISWFMEGETVRHATLTNEELNDSTIGILTYKPSADDDGRELTCRAENPRFPGSLMEKSMTISVHYPPSVSIRVDPGSDLLNLKEGDEVSFGCKIMANPDVSHISWFHGELYLNHDESNGVLMEGRSLRLVNLSNEQGGEYSCAARNDEGEARSLPVTLRVQYSPVCTPTFRTRTLAVLRHETIRVRCEVRADPRQVKFRWTFNTSNDVLPVPLTRSLTSNTTFPSSYIEFTPVADEDFGTLACWASNSIGFQSEPCVTHLVPARVPEPPNRCLLSNHSSGGVEVTCSPGDDGGLQQHFILEALESLVSFNDSLEGPFVPIPVFKVLGSEPNFLLQGLEPGRNYQLRIFALNAKGQSEPPVIIPYVKIWNSSSRLTSNNGLNETEISTDQSVSLLVILGSLIGIAIIVVCGLAFTTGLLACRKRGPTESQLQDKYDNNVMIDTDDALQKQEDAFIIKVPLPKVNNDTRESFHELSNMEVGVNDPRYEHDDHLVERPVLQTVVIRRSHVKAPPEVRNSTFRSSLEPRRTSSGYQPVKVTDLLNSDNRVLTSCKGVNETSSPRAAMGTPAELSAHAEDGSGREGNPVSRVAEAQNTVLVRTSLIEDAIRKNHPRVTLDPDGQVLHCILPTDDVNSTTRC